MAVNRAVSSHLNRVRWPVLTVRAWWSLGQGPWLNSVMMARDTWDESEDGAVQAECGGHRWYRWPL